MPQMSVLYCMFDPNSRQYLTDIWLTLAHRNLKPLCCIIHVFSLGFLILLTSEEAARVTEPLSALLCILLWFLVVLTPGWLSGFDNHFSSGACMILSFLSWFHLCSSLLFISSWQFWSRILPRNLETEFVLCSFPLSCLTFKDRIVVVRYLVIRKLKKINK